MGMSRQTDIGSLDTFQRSKLYFWKAFQGEHISSATNVELLL